MFKKVISTGLSAMMVFGLVCNQSTVFVNAQENEVSSEALNGIKSVEVDAKDKNIVWVTFGNGYKGKFTFLDNNIFRYNVDPSGEFSEYAKVRGGYPSEGKIQQYPDTSKEYSHPNATVSNGTNGSYEIKVGDVVVTFDKDAKMSIKVNGKTVMEEKEPLQVGNSTVQTLVEHSETNYSENLSEQYFGGGTQNGRIIHTGESINISNESGWNDGQVSSPNPFYYTNNGYGVLRNTWMDGTYDFGDSDQGTVTTTHKENEFDAYYFLSDGSTGTEVTQDLLQGYFKVTGNPVLLPEYGFYLGHLNAYNRDAWSDTEDIGTDWEIKGSKSHKESGEKTYEAGGTGYEIKANQNAETLNGTEPTVSTDQVPKGVKYDEKWSARAVLDEYQKYDMPLGFFLPNDGYGAGYGQNGYNMTGGVNEDGSSSKERLDAVAANVKNLEEFRKYATGKGVATGLWTQSALSPDSNPKTYWHTLRDFNAETKAGVTTLKTDVAWVGNGYSFQLSGVKNAYDTVIENTKARPNIISLDGWAGSQRYNSVWTGDQYGGKWEYIRFHIPTFIGQSLSGNPNIGSDMDGIWGGNPVIATRDYQWKSFAPQMLDMDGWGSYAKVPYVHGDPYTGVSRMYLKLKGKLMPYIYTNAYAAANMDTGNNDTGLPMVRAMFLEFPNEPTAYTDLAKYQYMWGENLLVAPLYEDVHADEVGNDVRNGIYLPGGSNQIWIDYFTGKQYRGGQVLNSFDAPIWKLPLFVKNGAIIPMYEEHNSALPETDDSLDKTKRIIEFWPEGETDFTSIEDDGYSMTNSTSNEEEYGVIEDIDYGSHVSTRFTSVAKDGTATLTAEKANGTYTGYNENKNTTFVVNASKKPASLEAYNGSSKLKEVTVDSKDAFDKATANDGEFVVFYDENPAIETFAPAEETEIADLVKDVKVSGKLYVKFAKTNTQENEQKLVINGFENKGDLGQDVVNEKLSVPANFKANEEATTPTSVTLNWDIVNDATSYEVLVDGTINGQEVTSGLIYSVENGEEFVHTGLEYLSTHHYRVRSVNKDGHSEWSTEISAKSADDPFRLAPTPQNLDWEGGLYASRGPELAFDEIFQEGDSGFHSDNTAIGKKLTVDYGNAYVLDKVEYYPRADANNGTVTKMRVETSLDGKHWIQHGNKEDQSGKYYEWERSGEAKLIDLSDPNIADSNSIGARYIRFTPLESVGDFFAAREIKVYTIENGAGNVDKPFRPGNLSSQGTSQPTLDLFKASYQKESSAHGSIKNGKWIAEIQKLYADINFNNISDIYDYAFYGSQVDGGTQKTGSVSGSIILEPSAMKVSAGEIFTINVTAVDVKNLNAYGTIIDYDPAKVEYVNTSYIGTGAMYTTGMTGDIQNSDGTAYINHNALNMGDQPLINGSKVLSTITMKAKADIDFTAENPAMDLSKVTLVGPDLSVVETDTSKDPVIPDIPTTTTKEYAQSDFTITMTNDELPTDDGTNVQKLIQSNSYDGLFNDKKDQTAGCRDFEFKWDIASNYDPETGQLPTYVTTENLKMHFTPVKPIPMSEVVLYNANEANGYVLGVQIEVTYDDNSEPVVMSINEKHPIYRFELDNSKNVKNIDIHPVTEPAKNLTIAEIDFLNTEGNPAKGIEPSNDSAKEVYVGYLGNVDAVITPEDCPNKYFMAESLDPEIATIVTLSDDKGNPVYKVRGVSEGVAKIKLTSAADENITCVYEVKVIAGVDKSNLQKAIDSYKDLTSEIYTEESYAKFKEAFDNAVAVYDDENATRAQVEQGINALENAANELEVVLSEKELASDIVGSSDALYSESNTPDKMLDGDLGTYWESPYSGENAKLPQDILIELNDIYNLEQVSFISHTMQNGGITDYEVSVSLDGNEWVKVANGTVNPNEYKQGNNVTVNARFASINAKYIKVTVKGAVGRIPEENNKYGRISEMKFYGEVYSVNKDALQSLVDEYSKLDETKYTEESWIPFKEALDEASALLKSSTASQTDIDSMVEKLKELHANLVVDTSEIDTLKEELKAKLEKAKAIDVTDYTEDSVEKLRNAMDNASRLLEDEYASAVQLQDAITNLQKAIEQLEKQSSVNKDALYELLEKYAGYRKSDYTEESWIPFKNAYDNASKVYTDKTASQMDVDKATETLKEYASKLVKAGNNNSGSDNGEDSNTGNNGNSSNNDEVTNKPDEIKTPATGVESSRNAIIFTLIVSGVAIAVIRRKKEA